MSWTETREARTGQTCRCAAVEQVIAPRDSDIGGLVVRRALPSAQRRNVGPFVFWDQMGPADFAVGQGIDVRPHPHIGLATVTYLFDGEIEHRDSLGTHAMIRPGELNVMRAGRGIVHSERTPQSARETGARLSGIQAWVALPASHEEQAPAFEHYPAASLPQLDRDGLKLRLIIGSLLGLQSPVELPMATIYAEARLDTGAELFFEAGYAERALYAVDGLIDIDGDRISPGQMVTLREGVDVLIRAIEPTRLMLLGGEPLDAPRHIWWNFVSRSRERIEQAKADWQQGRFDPVPGETEFIPLPGQGG